jgi:hypothetical protein
MVGGVTAIAQRDKVGGVVGATGGTRNEMVNVGLSLGAHFAAALTGATVAGEDDSPHGAPPLKVRWG